MCRGKYMNILFCPWGGLQCTLQRCRTLDTWNNSEHGSDDHDDRSYKMNKDNQDETQNLKNQRHKRKTPLTVEDYLENEMSRTN